MIAKIEKREAAEAAEEIVQAAAAASWSRAATSASRCRSRACRRSRSGCWRSPGATPGRHHGHPDARLDGPLDAPDPRRGDRRRERRLRRDRRADALRGDRDREIPDRGGADDGPDRRGVRAPSALRGMACTRAPATRSTTSPTPSPTPRSSAAYQLDLAVLVVPTRSGRTPRLVSAHRPRVPVLALSERIETVRRVNLLFGVQSAQHDEPPNLDELLASSAERARELGLRPLRRPDRHHGRPRRPGPRHEPARGPPGSVDAVPS